MSVTRLFGSSVKRREDPRMITGHGMYTDDVKLTGMTYMAILRSPYAHARIKSINTARARQLTDDLLRAIRANRAKAVVVDITGVPVVDSRVAQHLTQTIAAARLMGVTAIMTGVSGAVAEALVNLGVDIEGLNTVGDLQRGIEAAERLLGYGMVQASARLA